MTDDTVITIARVRQAIGDARRIRSHAEQMITPTKGGP